MEIRVYRHEIDQLLPLAQFENYVECGFLLQMDVEIDHNTLFAFCFWVTCTMTSSSAFSNNSPRRRQSHVCVEACAVFFFVVFGGTYKERGNYICC